MIKKIYAIICALSLMTAFSAVGMEKDTYPCDLCQKPYEVLNYTHGKTRVKECDHILCQRCHYDIKNSQTDPHYPSFGMCFIIDFEGDEEPEVSGICEACSYMHRVKNKQCWKDIQVQAIDTTLEDKHIVAATYFNTNHANRVLPNQTDTIPMPDNTTKQEEQIPSTTTDDTTYPCDNCQEPKELLNVLNRSNSSTCCQHILCNTCDETIKNTDSQALTSAPYYEELDEFSYDCEYCPYFKCVKNIRWKQQETKPIPFCDMIEQKAAWIKENYANGIVQDLTIKTETPKKIATRPTLLSTYNTKTEQNTYPCKNHRQIKSLLNQQDIRKKSINTTTAPQNLNDTQNPNHSTQSGMENDISKCARCKQEPSRRYIIHPSIDLTALVSLQWPFKHEHHHMCKTCENINISPLQLLTVLGCKDCYLEKNPTYAGCSNTRYWSEVVLITGIVCYGAYKAYHWWKGEEKTENNNEDEQDHQKEEAVNTTF